MMVKEMSGMRMDYVVGIDLGGTNTKVALVGMDGNLVQEKSAETVVERGPEKILAQIVEMIKSLADGSTDNCQAIGIGVPGSVNWARDTVVKPPNFPGWVSVNVTEEIQKLVGRDLPVLVENDANVAALGSAHFGAGIPYSHFIMITLGTGVGGAIIVDNQIFRGQTGGAGEIGHMTINYCGPLARSGVAGAAEAYLGQQFLTHHARLKLVSRPHSVLHQRAERDLADITSKMLYDAAQDGDKDAIEIFHWAGHKLGCVIGSAINLLDIRTAIIGGGTSAAGDLILDAARETVLDFVTPGLHEGIRILREERGNDVAMLGAARLALDFLSGNA
ncbi:MAG: ROK family protein [Rhodothermales bacterium]